MENALKHTRYSLFIILIAYAPLANGAVEIQSVTVLKLLALLIFFLWTASVAFGNRVALRSTPLDIPILLFISWAGVCAFFSVYPYAGGFMFQNIIMYGLVFFGVVQDAFPRHRCFRLVQMIVLFGGILATAGLVLVGGEFFGFKIFTTDHYRISFTFANRNYFAGYVLMITWLSIGLGLSVNGGKRIFYMSLGGYAALSVVFSLSRGGILSLICGLCFMLLFLLLNEKKRRHLVWIGICFGCTGLLMASLGLEPVIDRLRTLETPAMAGEMRLEIWKKRA